MKKQLLTALILTLFFAPSFHAESTPQDADLPRVLIIGDSISMAYTAPVAEMLKEVAAVEHHEGNAQHTGTGLKKIDQWIGETQWDVIHFNWGLWDLCYRHPKSKVQGKRDKVNGTLTTPIDVYEKNLDQLVTRLKQTSAKLIWAHTTVVPEKEAGRFAGDGKKYNAAATRVMNKHKISINDLHTLTAGFPAELFVKPGDVHYTPAGSKKIARQVANAMLQSLGHKPVTESEPKENSECCKGPASHITR